MLVAVATITSQSVNDACNSLKIGGLASPSSLPQFYSSQFRSCQAIPTLSLSITLSRMNPDLRDAAQQGRIDALYSLIRSDAYILDRVDALPFAQTPLHTAASSGQTNFALEIMGLKPSFARKLNDHGYTPLHLALQNERTRLVLRLLEIDENLVRVPGRGGLTPLHYVVQRGDLYLLTRFLEVCPRSIEDVKSRRESVLHIALRSDNIDAFKLLLGWLRRAWLKNAAFWEKKLLNWQDEEGNTLLHIAASKNLPEIVRLLLDFRSWFHCKIDLNAVNLGGQTVFEISQRQEIKDMLRHVKLLNTLFLPRVPSLVSYFKSPVPVDEKFYIFFLRQRMSISNESRKVLLVASVLLLVVTFQAIVRSPGGVRGVGPREIASSPAVGTSTMSQYPFLLVAALNLIGFFASLLAIFLILPCDFKNGVINLPFHLLSSFLLAAVLIIAPRTLFLTKWITSGSMNYYIFCSFSALLILLLQSLVNYRRRKLVDAFQPDGKVSDPTLT